MLGKVGRFNVERFDGSMCMENGVVEGWERRTNVESQGNREANDEL